jgi:hypothetical protein
MLSSIEKTGEFVWQKLVFYSEMLAARRVSLRR